ncbi:MAG: hypothetical protein ACRD3D_11045 [Terriglobia bacterium]
MLILSQCGLALVLLASASWAQARFPATAASARAIEQRFDGRLAGPRLLCSIQPVKPYLDFSFHFASGFKLRCPLRQFEGKEDALICSLRIVPAGRAPVVLEDHFDVPRMPLQMAGRVKPKSLTTDLHYSGMFSLGEGRYRVSLVVVDRRNHICSRSWTIKASVPASQSAAPLAAPPGTAGPLMAEPWKLDRIFHRDGLRLTILVNAEPLARNSPELQPRDRALLLDSVSSLMKQVSCQSVRLIAFNLDQDREIFTEQRFDQSGFRRLAEILRGLDLGTVSYHALGRSAWEHLLIQLMNQAAAPGDPQDAVIFLGPRTRIAKRISRNTLTGARRDASRLFYFQYFPPAGWGAEFPDAISYLTKARGGAVFKIHSPVELARAINKLQRDLSRSAPEDDKPDAARHHGRRVAAGIPSVKSPSIPSVGDDTEPGQTQP